MKRVGILMTGRVINSVVVVSFWGHSEPSRVFDFGRRKGNRRGSSAPKTTDHSMNSRHHRRQTFHNPRQTPLMTWVRSLWSWAALRSCDCFLQSSSPSHLWSSRSLCLLQNWPLQKPQSPTMRCAADGQSLKVHLVRLATILGEV